MDLPNKWTGSIHHHWQAELVFREHVAHCSSCDTQERASSESIKEARDQHGSDIFGDGAGDDPYQEEDVRVYVNWTTTIELKFRLAGISKSRYRNSPVVAVV